MKRCYSKCHLLELSDEHMSWHDLVLLMPTYKTAGYHCPYYIIPTYFCYVCILRYCVESRCYGGNRYIYITWQIHVYIRISTSIWYKKIWSGVHFVQSPSIPKRSCVVVFISIGLGWTIFGRDVLKNISRKSYWFAWFVQLAGRSGMLAWSGRLSQLDWTYV